MLSLAITFLIVSSLFGFYRLIAHTSDIRSHDEDIYIGVKQISQYVIGTKCVKVDGTYQYKDRDEQINEFVFEKGRLVKTPGYEIILTNVEGNFEVINEHIYIHISRDGHEYRFVLTYKDCLEDVKDEETES